MTELKINESRNQSIDALKGVAIFLVVLGHAIQTTTINFDHNLLFRLIYSFHMPLFMFISGWVMTLSRTDMPADKFFTSKSSRLVIPFICWYLLSFMLLGHFQNISLDQYLINLVINPDHGLWFLWILFLCQIILFFSKKLQPLLGDFHFLIPYFVILLLPMHYFGADSLKYYFKFFALGYVASRHQEFITKHWKTLIFPLAFSFPFLVTYWHRTGELTFIADLRRHIDNEYILTQLGDFYRFLVAIAGIASAFLLTKFLTNLSSGFRQYMAFLGMFTLEIYAIHFYFIGKINIGDGTGKIIANLICTLGLTYVSIIMIKKSAVLSRLLFGASSKK